MRLLRRLSIALPLALVATATLQVAGEVAAHADPSPSAWAKLRHCESGGNYSIVSRSGTYRGAYQFSVPTWRSVGGTGDPAKASVLEQDYRALYLYRMRGWEPWTCARMLGLKADKDAGSGVVPTYAEAREISGSTDPTPPTTTTKAPPWPGVTYNYGDCSPNLRTWQLQLNARHWQAHHFVGTGCYYADTKAAVIAIQKANGLPAHGHMGPRTWKAAWSGVVPK